MKFAIMLTFIGMAAANLDFNCNDPANNGRISFNLTQPVIACSRFLSCMIEKICNNSFKIIKRDTSYFINKLVPANLQEYASKKALVAEARSRRRRQVATECCLQPCRISNLIEYCPNNAKIFDEFPL